MTAATLRRADDVIFVQVEPRRYRRSEQKAITRYWDTRRASNPHLFDGPIIEAHSAHWHGKTCRIRWSVSSYSRYLWRHAPDANGRVPFARALFVSVLVTAPDGSVVLGRMGAHTSTPGRVQLPGGNLEQPPEGMPTLESARNEAARELTEETGLTPDLGGVLPWAVKTGGSHGDVGILFRSRAVGVERCFSRHHAAVTRSGQVPEFSSLLLVGRTPGRGCGLVPQALCPHVDYLPALLRTSLGSGAVRVREVLPQATASEEAQRVRG